MTKPTKEQTQAVKKEGIEIERITFDANGKAQGLEDKELDDVAGGLMDEEASTNGGCVNAYKC